MISAEKYSIFINAQAKLQLFGPYGSKLEWKLKSNCTSPDAILQARVALCLRPHYRKRGHLYYHCIYYRSKGFHLVNYIGGGGGSLVTELLGKSLIKWSELTYTNIYQDNVFHCKAIICWMWKKTLCHLEACDTITDYVTLNLFINLLSKIYDYGRLIIAEIWNLRFTNETQKNFMCNGGLNIW